MNLQDIRDLVIIIAGCLTALVLVATLIVVVVVGIAAKGLISAMKTMLKGQLSPTLDSAKAVVDDIRGTTAFIADTTVSPLIRLYGLVTAIRRGAMALVGLGRRKGRA
jgi:hypothetical protein